MALSHCVRAELRKAVWNLRIVGPPRRHSAHATCGETGRSWVVRHRADRWEEGAARLRAVLAPPSPSRARLVLPDVRPVPQEADFVFWEVPGGTLSGPARPSEVE